MNHDERWRHYSSVAEYVLRLASGIVLVMAVRLVLYFTPAAYLLNDLLYGVCLSLVVGAYMGLRFNLRRPARQEEEVDD